MPDIPGLDIEAIFQPIFDEENHFQCEELTKLTKKRSKKDDDEDGEYNEQRDEGKEEAKTEQEGETDSDLTNDIRVLYNEHQNMFANTKDTIIQLKLLQQSIQDNKNKSEQQLRTFVSHDMANSVANIISALQEQFQDSREKIDECKPAAIDLPPLPLLSDDDSAEDDSDDDDDSELEEDQESSHEDD